jgi:hypothetical protein
MDKSDLQNTVKELMQVNKIEKIALTDLEVKKKIGQGGQASVYRANFENKAVAVKVMQETDFKCLTHEIVIISNLLHENIPKFYGIVLEDKVISLVSEYIKGKPLDELHPNLISNQFKVKIIKQLASALEYMHTQKYIHRDLKPENLMIDSLNEKLYLIDFGISKDLGKNSNILTRAKGTVYYLAPECFDASDIDQDHSIISTIGFEVDVWAFGCIVSWMFSNVLPWCNKYKNKEAIIRRVLELKKPFVIPDNIKNEDILELIKMCTKTQPSERSTMSEINKFLENIQLE